MNPNSLKLFLKDNIALFSVVAGIQIFFFGTLLFIKGIWIRELFYYVFLTLFTLTIYFVIRYYRRYRVYDRVSLKTYNLDDYLIEEPRSIFEEEYNSLIQEIQKIDRKKTLLNKKEKEQQKILMYRFVHQIKTPVSVISLITEKHQEEEDYNKISKSLDVIQYNLNQMLDIYRLEDFKNDFVAERVNLNQVCRDSINSLKDYFISSNIFPKLEVDENIYVYSDPKWLKIVLHQLVTNAVKYSYDNGSVLIKAEKIEDKALLEIVDNGVGINEAEISKIFDLFYIGEKGRKNADSSGIGLFIAKSIIDYLGHEIEIESDMEKKETKAKIYF